MDTFRTFIEQPLVAPLYFLMLLLFLDWVSGIYVAWTTDTFNWSKFSKGLIDDSKKVFLPALVGLAGWLAPTTQIINVPGLDAVTPQSLLYGFYLAAIGAELISQIASLREKQGQKTMLGQVIEDPAEL